MNFTGSLPTIAALRTRRSSEIVITETKFRRTLTRLTGSGAGLRPLPALRQRFAPDGCSHATRGVACALTIPSVRRQSTNSTRSGRFTRVWLVRPPANPPALRIPTRTPESALASTHVLPRPNRLLACSHTLFVSSSRADSSYDLFESAWSALAHDTRCLQSSPIKNLPLKLILQMHLNVRLLIRRST